MQSIVERTERGWEIAPLVGVDERPIRVRNEGISMAATIVILEHYADAACILNRESDFSRRCREGANGLRKALDLLYNGNFFVAAEGSDKPAWGMVYPMKVVPFDDPRALSTANVMIEAEARDIPSTPGYYNFPWHHGILGMILAREQNGNAAWTSIQHTRPTICQFGGMAEVTDNNGWNMQYFCTAQAAVMIAIHNIMLQGSEGSVSIFPALPGEWQACSFERLLAPGVEVSASYDHGQIQGNVKNITSLPLERIIRFGTETQTIHLNPGQSHVFTSSK